ncbi:hypothetical protein BDAP_002004 [Binucleata daphniae]
MDHTRESYFDSFHQTHNGELKNSYYNPFMVKHRRRTSKMQLKILEKTFETNVRPDAALRKVLGEQLGMTPRSVQVWFQNRRAKVKKTKKDDQKPTLEDESKKGSDKTIKYDEQQNAGLYKRTNNDVFTSNFADEILYDVNGKNNAHTRKYENVEYGTAIMSQSNTHLHNSTDNIQGYTTPINSLYQLHSSKHPQNFLHSQLSASSHDNMFLECYNDKNQIQNNQFYQDNCEYNTNNFAYYLEDQNDYYTADNFYKNLEVQQSTNEYNNNFAHFYNNTHKLYQSEEINEQEVNNVHEYVIDNEKRENNYNANYEQHNAMRDDRNLSNDKNTKYINTTDFEHTKNQSDESNSFQPSTTNDNNKDDTKCIISPLSPLNSPQ